jgi:hypothetical protein
MKLGREWNVLDRGHILVRKRPAILMKIYRRRWRVSICPSHYCSLSCRGCVWRFQRRLIWDLMRWVKCLWIVESRLRCAERYWYPTNMLIVSPCLILESGTYRLCSNRAPFSTLRTLDRTIIGWRYDQDRTKWAQRVLSLCVGLGSKSSR